MSTCVLLLKIFAAAVINVSDIQGLRFAGLDKLLAHAQSISGNWTLKAALQANT